MQSVEFHASVKELEQKIIRCVEEHFMQKGISFDPKKIPNYFECVRDKSFDTHLLGANVFPEEEEQSAA